MWFLYLVSWVALIVQLCFVLLSMGAGLYYLAALMEEFTYMSARIIKYMLWGSSLILLALMAFENLPLLLLCSCLTTNVMYYFVLDTFPYIQPKSPVFIVSIFLLVIDHYLAFCHFSVFWYPFNEMLAFFTLCLWLVPFALLVSLSLEESPLPTKTNSDAKSDSQVDVVTNYLRQKGRRYGLLSVLKQAQESVLPQRVKKGY